MRCINLGLNWAHSTGNHQRVGEYCDWWKDWERVANKACSRVRAENEPNLNAKSQWQKDVVTMRINVCGRTIAWDQDIISSRINALWRMFDVVWKSCYPMNIYLWIGVPNRFTAGHLHPVDILLVGINLEFFHHFVLFIVTAPRLRQGWTRRRINCNEQQGE